VMQHLSLSLIQTNSFLPPYQSSYSFKSSPSWSVICFSSIRPLLTFSQLDSGSTKVMLSSYVAPFFTLQYPTATPVHPDSFPHSTYYNAGKLDICIVIGCIATMALLRDASRLGIFEPLARWKLLRDLELTRKRVSIKSNCIVDGDPSHHHIANGNGDINGGDSTTVSASRKELRQLNRSVLRFAEQGWSVVYYSLQWSFGLVRTHFS